MPDNALPADYPLSLYRGDTRVWRVLIEETTASGTAPRDLTDHTFRAEIRTTPHDDVMAEIAVETDTDPTTGQLTLTLTATEAAKLRPGAAYWDLQITRTADDFVRTYLAGRIMVQGDISHV